MKYLFENCFLLITIKVSTSSKKFLTKKILFPLARKSVCTSWMRDIEKYVSILRKSCFHFKNLWKNFKNQLFTKKSKLFLWRRFSPNSNNDFHLRKNSSDKKTLFSLGRKTVFTSRMKNLFKNTFSPYSKDAST